MLHFLPVMDSNYEQKYHAIEDHFWWFLARRDYLQKVMRRYAIAKDAAILEVGCSGGPLLAELQAAGYTNLRGLDVSPVAIDRAKARGLSNLFVMDATKPDFPDNTFDLLIASDILEHLQKPQEALAQWQRILKPGGLAIILVPAFMFLWSEHDEVNHHFHRYTRHELAALLGQQGLEVVTSSYWNFALFPPVTAIRVLKRLLPKPKRPPQDQLSPPAAWLNSLLYGLLRCENSLLAHHVRFPFGVSALAIGRKPAAA